MTPPRTLRIERLVLDGFPSSERNRIAAALQSELQRLLGAANLPASVAVSLLDAGGLEVQPGAGPEATGTQAARQLFRRLTAIAGPGPAVGQARPAGRRRGGGA